MTSAVLIFSMLPVAMALSDSSSGRAPLGAVLVGGMATSTLLSLLYVPVAYTYFDSLSALIGKVFTFKPRLPSWPFSTGGASAERSRGPAHGSAAPMPVAGGASVAAVRVQSARGLHRRSRAGSIGRGPSLAPR
jgi:HAE1 family hydrophobic/amphiphilic exporter-1